MEKFITTLAERLQIERDPLTTALREAALADEHPALHGLRGWLVSNDGQKIEADLAALLQSALREQPALQRIILRVTGMSTGPGGFGVFAELVWRDRPVDGDILRTRLEFDTSLNDRLMKLFIPELWPIFHNRLVENAILHG